MILTGGKIALQEKEFSLFKIVFWKKFFSLFPEAFLNVTIKKGERILRLHIFWCYTPHYGDLSTRRVDVERRFFFVLTG